MACSVSVLVSPLPSPYDIIFFGRGVHSVSLVLGEVDEVHSILLAVDGGLLRPLLAVVDDDLVVGAAGDDVHPIVAVVDVGDLVLVLLVVLRHPHRPEQGGGQRGLVS